MSETCCYCGETLLSCPWHRPDRELLERGYHYWCHQTRQEPGMLRAQLAALAAAHDAAMAEAERQRDEIRRLLRGAAAQWKHRADTAEAQIAEAREEYAELLRMNHGLAAAARRDAEQLAQARADGARSMVEWLQQFDGIAGAELEDSDAVLAAWQAHETKEDRGCD